MYYTLDDIVEALLSPFVNGFPNPLVSPGRHKVNCEPRKHEALVLYLVFGGLRFRDLRSRLGGSRVQ